MTEARPTISVVIVSRGRPQSLSLCLLGVARLVYSPYEIIVVADAAGLAAARALPFADALKLVPCDEPNISLARNRGIREAAGEIVAFIEDDAVPEPMWLERLHEAFALPGVSAVGGFVRGRNGISWQWRGRSVDCQGQAHTLAIEGLLPVLPAVPERHAVKTEGTNMAVRRSVLAKLGGFDPAFRFFLDETDLNFRLAEQGHRTALAPAAEVHHAYGPSDLRRGDRAVRDLSAVGQSSMVFLRRHASPETHADRLSKIRLEQNKRLLQQMVDGLIEPRDVRRLLGTLEQGFDAGLAIALPHLTPLPPPASPFLPFQSLTTGEHRVISGRYWRVRAIRREAEALAQEGHVVSVYVFSRTFLFHSLRFKKPGIWWQRGGLWGRSERRLSLRQFNFFAKRVQIECQRVASARWR